MNFNLEIVRNGGRCRSSCMFLCDDYCALFHYALDFEEDSYLTCDPCDQIVTANCMKQSEVKA